MITSGMAIDSGALVALNSSVHSSFSEDFGTAIWAPKITIITPERKGILKIENGNLMRNGTPYFIRGERRGGVWYHFSENLEGLSIGNYHLFPGKLKEELESIYVFKDGFVPDKKDETFGVKDVSIIKGDSDLSYFDLHLVAHTHSEQNTSNIVYNLLFSPGIKFGYDCKHSGDITLNSGKIGSLEASLDQRSNAAKKIFEDFKSSFK